MIFDPHEWGEMVQSTGYNYTGAQIEYSWSSNFLDWSPLYWCEVNQGIGFFHICALHFPYRAVRSTLTQEKSTHFFCSHYISPLSTDYWWMGSSWRKNNFQLAVFFLCRGGSDKTLPEAQQTQAIESLYVFFQLKWIQIQSPSYILTRLKHSAI